MTRLLDARTSQNASFEESLTTALPADSTAFIGQVGLNIFNPVGTIRVQLYAVSTFLTAFPLGTDYRIFIVRGTLFTDPLVYSGTQSSPPNFFQTLTAVASDYNVPAPPNNQLIYSVFVSSSNDATRIGPESFNAVAFCDD